MYEEWKINFPAFLKAVGERPSPSHSIDRIRNQEGYVPGNVQWATKKEQARNMRKNHLLTHNGQTKTIAEWAEITGLVPSAIHYRVTQGKMTDSEALTTPKRWGRPSTSDGTTRH